MDLATGQVTTVERVKSFKVPEESGAFVAYLLEPPLKKPDEKKDEAKKEPEAKPEAKPEVKPEAKKEEPKAGEPKKEEKKKEPGTDFVVRELATGKETKIAEVVEYAWNKPGTWLAYGVSSKTPENDGAFALEAATGKTVPLLKGLGNYKNLTFDEKGLQLAFTSDRDDYKSEKSASKLYYWTPAAKQASPAAGAAKPAATTDAAVELAPPANKSAPAAGATELAPAGAKGFPARHGRQRERPAPVLQGRRAALLRHRGGAQARAQGRARAGQGRHLELERPLPAADAKVPGR